MKKTWTILICIAVMAGMFAGCGSTPVMVDADGNYIIALLPMEDSYRAVLEAGAEKAAGELGVEVANLLSPAEEAEGTETAEPAETEETAQTEEPAQSVTQADRIRQAVSAGYRGIVVACDGNEETDSALEEAIAAGVKVVCVGYPTDIEASAVLTEDHKAAGKAAGEALRSALEMKGIHEGAIGIVNDSNALDSALQREAGFRDVFAETAFTLLETRYDEGSAAKAGIAAKKLIRQDAVGVFGGSTVSLEALGTAIRDAAVDVVAVGCGTSGVITDLIEEGYILASAVPDYEVLGYDAIRAAAAALKEETPEESDETAISLLKAEEDAVPASVTGAGFKIALIATDRIEQSSAAMEEGAAKAAEELGCEVVSLSPVIRDEERQAEQIRQAVESGCHAIVIAVNPSDVVSTALKDAYNAGVKIVYVDTPARIRAEITYVTDNRAVGRKAGETMLAELKAREITEGTISLIGADTDNHAAVQREAGFREVFEGEAYTLQETRYSEGDAARSHALAKEDIVQGAIGMFAAGEAETIGAGNAAAERRAKTVVVGFGTSEAILELIEEDYLLATVVPEYSAMGYEGVKAACAALSGNNLRGAITDVGAAVVTK